MNGQIAQVADELIADHLSQDSQVALSVSTWSMAPFIQPGDQVIVRQAQVADLRLGDIIAVRNTSVFPGTNTTVLTHRFIGVRRIDNTMYLATRPDYSYSLDELWQTDQLLGVVVAVKHKPSAKASSLLMRRARWLNRIIGILVRGQSLNYTHLNGIVRRLALVINGRLVRASAWLARWIVGWI